MSGKKRTGAVAIDNGIPVVLGNPVDRVEMQTNGTASGVSHGETIAGFADLKRSRPEWPLGSPRYSPRAFGAAVDRGHHGAADRVFNVHGIECFAGQHASGDSAQRSRFVPHDRVPALAAPSVSAVATNFGFFDLGRFSMAYRKLFGELPSARLQRRC